MFRSILILTLVSMPVFGVNKCVIDGKTIYQQAACPPSTEIEMSVKGVSTVGSQKLREQAEEKQLLKKVQEEYLLKKNQEDQILLQAQEKQEISQEEQEYIQELMNEAELRPANGRTFSEMAEIKARRDAARAKLYELGLRSKTDDKLDDISRKLKTIRLDIMNR